MKKTRKKKQKHTIRIGSANKSDHSPEYTAGIRMTLSERQAEALRYLYVDRDEMIYEEVYTTMNRLLFYVRHSEVCLTKMTIEALNVVDFHTQLLNLDLTNVQKNKIGR